MHKIMPEVRFGRYEPTLLDLGRSHVEVRSNL